MKFSSEQKEILKTIFAYTQRGDCQPKPYLFETIISKFTPEDCFVNFCRHLQGFRIYIYNKSIIDEKEVDKINGKILTYLFLIDLLVKDNYVIIYKIKNDFNYDNVFLGDKKGKSFEEAPESKPFISPALYSPTFWEIIEKYGNTVIQPSYSLIHLISNDFETDSEIAMKKSLRKTETGLTLTKIAVGISLVAFIVSVFVGIKSLQIDKRVEKIAIESLDVSKESLKYTRQSATEIKQNDLLNEFKLLPYRLDSLENRK